MQNYIDMEFFYNALIYSNFMDTIYKTKYAKYKNKYLNLTDKLGGNQITLGIRDPWLFYIQTGKKKIEGRLGNGNAFQDWIGKIIKLVNKTRSFPVKVIDVRHYNTLYDFLNAEDYQSVLPGIKSMDEAIDTYHKFYSDTLIKEKGGICAIEIELV